MLAKAKHYRTDAADRQQRFGSPISRSAFSNGDLSTVISPRTVITWAESAEILATSASPSVSPS